MDRAWSGSRAHNLTAGGADVRARCTATAVPHAPAPRIATTIVIYPKRPSTVVDSMRGNRNAATMPTSGRPLQTPDLLDTHVARLAVAMANPGPAGRGSRVGRVEQF